MAVFSRVQLADDSKGTLLEKFREQFGEGAGFRNLWMAIFYRLGNLLWRKKDSVPALVIEGLAEATWDRGSRGFWFPRLLGTAASRAIVGQLPDPFSRSAALLLEEIDNTAQNERRLIVVARNAIHNRAGV